MLNIVKYGYSENIYYEWICIFIVNLFLFKSMLLMLFMILLNKVNIFYNKFK